MLEIIIISLIGAVAAGAVIVMLVSRIKRKSHCGCCSSADKYCNTVKKEDVSGKNIINS